MQRDHRVVNGDFVIVVKSENKTKTDGRKRKPKAQETAADPNVEPKKKTVARKGIGSSAQSEISALLKSYRERITPALMKEFSYKTPMQVPRPIKVVLNVGIGEATTNSKILEEVTKDLEVISGQKPVTTRARKSIAGFKLREGEAIGVMVTMRGHRMWTFLDKLFNAALPRIRDFRGLSRSSFDSKGNYTLGIKEQIIFPEIEYNQVAKIRSLQVSIVTTADTNSEGMRLLELLGMPFTRQGSGA